MTYFPLKLSQSILDTYKSKEKRHSEPELIHQPAHPKARKQPHPILFVPGAFAGAWLWKDNFLKEFSALGFDCYAMSFRGHGKNRLRHSFNGLTQHVEDLRQAISKIPQSPILVGYSLGGLVLHRHLQTQEAPAALMLSAIPPDGLWNSVKYLFNYDPISAAKMLGLITLPSVRHLASPPKGIYSESIDPKIAAQLTKQLKAEPIRVLSEALSASQGDQRIRQGTPLKLYGATGDHIIPASEVERSAKLLEAPVKIFEGMSHSLMAEPNAHELVTDMLDFLNQKSLYVK